MSNFKVIWKFPLVWKDSQSVQMHEGAELLSVQMQRGILCLWALVDPATPKQNRTIEIVGTGHPFDPTWCQFIGTVQADEGRFVWHVFERINTILAEGAKQ